MRHHRPLAATVVVAAGLAALCAPGEASAAALYSCERVKIHANKDRLKLKEGVEGTLVTSETGYGDPHRNVLRARVPIEKITPHEKFFRCWNRKGRYWIVVGRGRDGKGVERWLCATVETGRVSPHTGELRFATRCVTVTYHPDRESYTLVFKKKIAKANRFRFSRIKGEASPTMQHITAVANGKLVAVEFDRKGGFRNELRARTDPADAASFERFRIVQDWNPFPTSR